MGTLSGLRLKQNNSKGQDEQVEPITTLMAVVVAIMRQSTLISVKLLFDNYMYMQCSICDMMRHLEVGILAPVNR